MKRAQRTFRFDLAALALLAVAALVLAGQSWLRDHPQHNPWAPLRLGDPVGWATARKLADLRDDIPECRAFLDRSGVAAEVLEPSGEGACLRDDRLRLEANASLDGINLSPQRPQTTCPVHAALAMWFRHGVQPAAEATLGSQVARIEHLGTANCRRIGGGASGRWSEHATGNAIDIAAFVLADGRRISVLGDWTGDGDEAAFLRLARDRACDAFGTVLSPDYNADHADHFHLDQAERTAGWSVCR